MSTLTEGGRSDRDEGGSRSYRETQPEQQGVLGEDHPNTLVAMSNVARLYGYQGRYAEAEPLFLATLEAQRRVLGDGHPNTLISMGNLSEIYVALGRAEEAEPLMIEALAGARTKLPREHLVHGAHLLFVLLGV